MPIPQSKDELLKDIRTSYAKLKILLDTITDQEATEAVLTGHAQNTTMNICNLIAYLIGWGELVIKWHTKTSQGEAIDMPETGYKWNELGLLAQKFYQDYGTLNFSELNKHLELVVKQIILIIEEQTNNSLYEVPWYKQWTKGRLIQLNTSSPYRNAAGRIRKWRKGQFIPK